MINDHRHPNASGEKTNSDQRKISFFRLTNFNSRLEYFIARGYQKHGAARTTVDR